jgi:hypothetical protein
MGFFDRFKDTPSQASTGAAGDEAAIARYRYLLKTAPPEAVEQAHAEAFAQLTPEQRRQLLAELGADMPEAERAAALRAGDAPAALARVATRAEMREPGAMERASNRLPGGMGGMFAGSLLGSIAGTVLGTMIAQQFFAQQPDVAADATANAGDSLADDPWQQSDAADFDGGSFDV